MPTWAIILVGIMGGFIVLYFLFAFIIAKVLANIIYTPPKSLATDYEKIKKITEKVCNVDYADFDGWDKEQFFVENDDYDIPCEYNPLPNAKGIAIVIHGFGQNRCMVVPHAKILRDLGFSTILFDQRRFGISKAAHGGLGYIERQDTAKVVEYVRKRFGNNIKLVLLGCSMGAISVLSCSRYTSERIDAIIEDSSPDRVENIIKPFTKVVMPLPNPFLVPIVKATSKKVGYDITDNNPIEVAEKLTCPVLILHGEKDRTVPVQCSYNIMKVLKNPLSRIEVFPSYDHCLQIGDTEKYAKTVKEFLDEVLK